MPDPHSHLETSTSWKNPFLPSWRSPFLYRDVLGNCAYCPVSQQAVQQDVWADSIARIIPVESKKTWCCNRTVTTILGEGGRDYVGCWIQSKKPCARQYWPRLISYLVKAAWHDNLFLYLCVHILWKCLKNKIYMLYLATVDIQFEDINSA